MLSSLRKNGLTSLFKEVRVFKVRGTRTPQNPFRNPSETLLGFGGSVAGMKVLRVLVPLITSLDANTCSCRVGHLYVKNLFLEFPSCAGFPSGSGFPAGSAPSAGSAIALCSRILVARAIRNAIRARVDSRESFAIETPIFIARQADSPESLEFPIR